MTKLSEVMEMGDCPVGDDYPVELRTKMKKGKPEIVKEGEASYGGDYQAMVLRVKEKARQQAERKKTEHEREKAKDATDPNSDRFTSGSGQKPFKNPSIVKANESYNDNRHGFKRREREDDEYHTPDPVGQTHKVGFHVSKEGEEKHHRTVTFTNSTKTSAEAKTAAKAHLQSKGYTIHEETELEEGVVDVVKKVWKKIGELDSSSPKYDGNTRRRQELRQKLKKEDVVLEAKDEQEYGYEGDMAMNQLETVIRHATYLKDMMKPDTDLPEWVQSKITLATDYLQTACDYMTSEMNEEVKDEYARKVDKYLKKKYNKEEPPFDGPYKKTPKVVKDKSGAEHNPMSRARDLARQAAKRQAGLKKESLDESRKAEIVKEIIKGKKKQSTGKFEPNPELQSTVVKSDN